MYTTEQLLQLQFDLTKIAVSEFGFLHPKSLVNKSLTYYDERHWLISNIPATFRGHLSRELREPDVSSPFLRNLLGGLMESVPRDKAVAFINQIDDIYISDGDSESNSDEDTEVKEDLCLVFYGKSRDWLFQTCHWFSVCGNYRKWKEYSDLYVSFVTKPRPKRSAGTLGG